MYKKMVMAAVAVLALTLGACNYLTGGGPIYDFKSPRGGEVWPLGSTQIIRWGCNGYCSDFSSTRISVKSADDQNPPVGGLIGVGGNEGSFTWTVGTFASDPRKVVLKPGIYGIHLANENTGGGDGPQFNITP